MNGTTCRRFAKRDRVFLEFNPALFEFVAQKRKLDQESLQQKTCFDNGGLVLVHRRTSWYGHTSSVSGVLPDRAVVVRYRSTSKALCRQADRLPARGASICFVTKTSEKVTL